MGLLGGVFNDGHTVGQHRRQHDVHGGPHGDHIQIDLSSGQPALGNLRFDDAVDHFDLGSHGDKALDVLVNGAAAQVAAPGHGDLRPAEAAQQSTHQVVAGADFPGQAVGDFPVADAGAVDFYGSAVDGAHLRA